MSDRFDVLSPRPGKDGKTYWLKVGSQFRSKDGAGWTIKLDANPLPNKEGEIWLTCKEPKERDGQPFSHKKSNPLDDDIPFN